MRTSAVSAGLVFAALASFPKYRAWHLHWGATPVEVEGPMPGDAVLDRAEFVATRAISIAATPAEVWPWLVQVGYGRAGFYSYDVLDNLGRPSASEILPAFQGVAGGRAQLVHGRRARTAPHAAVVEARLDLVVAAP